MRTLALDTTLEACQVAVLDGDAVLASLSEPMHRGHQERLGTMVAEAMEEAGLGFGALDRIGVTVGPGSFTGLRVGLAFAKGLALARGVPCVGVGALHALAASVQADGLVAAAVDARRGQVYLQTFSAGLPSSEPEVLQVEDAVRALAGLGPLLLAGSAAAMLAERLPGARDAGLTVADPVSIARLAALAVDPPPAAPLYLRAPDAKLPA